jgi:ribosomal protein S18 acetylase RimI-like enzyme
VIRELGPGETGLAFEAMRALRPALASEDDFVARVDGVQRAEGYRVVAAFDDGAEQAVAVAGFRLGHNLAWGRFLYVDDLSTLESTRRRGHARTLMDWLVEEAQREACDQLHLDSNTGPERAAAHRLYFNAGLIIASYHFARRV